MKADIAIDDKKWVRTRDGPAGEVENRSPLGLNAGSGQGDDGRQSLKGDTTLNVRSFRSARAMDAWTPFAKFRSRAMHASTQARQAKVKVTDVITRTRRRRSCTILSAVKVSNPSNVWSVRTPLVYSSSPLSSSPSLTTPTTPPVALLRSRTSRPASLSLAANTLRAPAFAPTSHTCNFALDPAAASTSGSSGDHVAENTLPCRRRKNKGWLARVGWCVEQEGEGTSCVVCRVTGDECTSHGAGQSRRVDGERKWEI